MSKEDNNVLITLGLLGVVSLAWFFDHRQNKKVILQQRNQIKSLEKQLETYQDLAKMLTIILDGFISSKKHNLPSDYQTELYEVKNMIKNNFFSSAVLKFAKILENTLKEHIKDLPEFKDWLNKNIKKSNFNDFLEYLKQIKHLNEEQFLQLKILKSYRNKEAHELNVRTEGVQVLASFNIGLQLISKYFKR